MVACIVHSEQMYCTHNKQTNKRIAGHRARKLIIRNAGHGKITDETNKRTKMWQLFIEFPDSSLPKRCFFVFRGWCWYQFDLFSFFADEQTTAHSHTSLLIRTHLFAHLNRDLFLMRNIRGQNKHILCRNGISSSLSFAWNDDKTTVNVQTIATSTYSNPNKIRSQCGLEYATHLLFNYEHFVYSSVGFVCFARAKKRSRKKKLSVYWLKTWKNKKSCYYWRWRAQSEY